MQYSVICFPLEVLEIINSGKGAKARMKTVCSEQRQREGASGDTAGPERSAPVPLRQNRALPARLSRAPGWAKAWSADRGDGSRRGPRAGGGPALRLLPTREESHPRTWCLLRDHLRTPPPYVAVTPAGGNFSAGDSTGPAQNDMKPWRCRFAPARRELL